MVENVDYVQFFCNYSKSWVAGRMNVIKYAMFCTIWYHLYNLKNVKNTHGGVLLLVNFVVENIDNYYYYCNAKAFPSIFSIIVW